MVKPAATAVSATSRIAEIRPLAALGDAYEDSTPWMQRLVKGQSYAAQVLARLDDKTFSVSLGGQAVALTAQAELAAGQTIRLQYLSDQPAPTFMLLSAPQDGESSTASLSNTGQLIDHYLQAAKQQGTTAVFEAMLAVSSNPADAGQLAVELKQALSHSGLFYESHLAEWVQGSRTLAEVQQEAQNLATQNLDNGAAAGLLVKQLGILENQRVLWHGEIWPRQTMQWQLQREQQAGGRDAQPTAEHADVTLAISSSLSLQLPRLGQVIARLQLAHGAMRITLSAAEPNTVDKLAQAGAGLVAAIESSTHAVPALAIVQHD